MADTDREHLLEIYKLHAGLADHVSQRREGANRLYVSLHVGLVVLLAALVRFGVGDVPTALMNAIIGAVGLFGVLVSISWLVVLAAYRQLNRMKFAAMDELEEQLPYQFFKKEWEHSADYRKLTRVEGSLPIIFCALYALPIGYSIYTFLCE